MSSVENVMTNDDLDELTAMLQSLDEPVKKAAQVENTDDIDDLLLGLDAGVAMSSDDVAEESAPFPQPVKSDAAITTLISAVDKNLRFI